jgi:hypothetical protein
LALCEKKTRACTKSPPPNKKKKKEKETKKKQCQYYGRGTRCA